MVDDHSADEHRRQAESRAALLAEQRLAVWHRVQERQQRELQEREARIKREFGAQLEQTIGVAGIEDEQTKALAIDYLTKNIAAGGALPSQMMGEDLRRLGELSIKQATEFEEQQRQQQPAPGQHQEQPRGEQVQQQGRAGNPTHDYAPLNETHREVDNATTAELETGVDAPPTRGERENRYEPLNETHREVAAAIAPLNRSEREAVEAETQLTTGEVGDARQARAAMLRK
jgi:hypothetical protein